VTEGWPYRLDEEDPMSRFLRLTVTVLALSPVPALAQTCLVPDDQIVSGGPGKDGIPALTRPAVVSATQADGFLEPDSLVLGVAIGGEARAYPHNVLWWHEIVNDVLGATPITVSYCPLTGSGMVYDPVIAGTAREFGVSGLLFDNNLILYDRSQQETLWSQMRVQGICGALAGETPRLLPVVQATWAAWKAQHPETTVVSFDTGFRRNYDVYPYGTYDQISDRGLLFPHSFIDERRPMKEVVLGIEHEGVSRAYPHGLLGVRTAVNDEVAGLAVLVVFDAAAQMGIAFERSVGEQILTFDVESGTGFPFSLRDAETGTLWDLGGAAVEGPLSGSRLEPIATYSAMWFAWASFNRGTEIYAPRQE
jgi:hypothetical protein